MSFLKKGEPAPYFVRNYEDHEIHAIQAMSLGTANPEQQKMALKFIVEALAGTYDVSYRSSSDRDTSFCEGRRFVGLKLITMIKLNLGNLKRERLLNGKPTAK